jgi:two-component system KDP operon response regulator KdpE
MMPQSTILLVDGEGSSAAWLRSHLEVEGFHVLIASDASSALDTVRGQSPALVMLCAMTLFAGERSDLGHAGTWRRGSQLLQDLRRESIVGVIALSGKRGAEKMVHFVDLGASEHLTWPFSRQRLMACIRTVLRQANRAGQEDGYVA